MQVFESLDFEEKFANPILTIGNYDGLHLGHRKIIERVEIKARENKGTSMLMTFHPHPLTILKPDRFIGLITPLPVKRRLIEEAGIDVMFIIPFTDEFHLISPESFVENILVQKLGIKGLIVGYDFKFGKGGKGNVEYLAAKSTQYGFFFDIQEAITLDNEKVGSNRIRRMIQEGDVKKAGLHLGRPYMIGGTVMAGDGRGRTIGFPTINLQTEFPLIPGRGVYVSSVEIGGKRLPAVTNIGFNPTFDGQSLTIETYIMDFSQDLYNQKVALYFLDRIRDEVKFSSVDELKDRIRKDVEIARAYFTI
ncbi:MAG TPA: bifunctional riboflavin kinase/FAD synthetase [Syntrophorhabdus sp.]|mgnify:FL=1|jgi:riboflavin kinase/FMN adenylyltransferase|nr:bifunctional riboflavin kinase/FAD synthetase [Syntrophorhabdus sp.]OPX95008.1 MAG: Riboflavin biosynthesis protein RibF [Syntrophorhabdus sp. PtaB.Bin027]OQB77434.1 MAG: Riboflavin biosynthesis protein RibF [Deltaproteobacteria bacterium ADurb.Bin135]HNQ46127.1 bifunctional riboflavin kinase/FAD synthetase [Syntrophorhabdus sp.]HOD77548.1 bifunctional riboflavin kinase/FAD synthetase [Syntrophorhabdus sp.]